jgi:rhamnopyranosyl-N-acetylglucosaminyl-diphospho-decaprenol beta-1,3/1,4-galactofuranosyltransferase
MHVTAIFATMNRSATAVGCVRALAAQVRLPERVIVADNVSSDTTVADLRALENLPFALVVVEMPENVGNAGGVAAAMERAFADGTDAVWILDDDSWPRTEALAALLEEPWERTSVRHAHQIDPETGRFTWPLQVADGDGWRMAWTMDELPVGEWCRTRILWTGTIVTRQVREAVGPVMAELFIRGEDEEYPLRAERAGIPYFACRGAIMDHPGPDDLVEWKCLGKRLFYERGLADWKLYYKVRNMVWLKKQYDGPLKAVMMSAAYTLAALTLDGPGRLALLAHAIRDGWQARLGKWEKHR